MTGGQPGPYERRPLRDLGAGVALLLSRPVLAWFNRGDDPVDALTKVELRAVVRRPQEAMEVALANFFRAYAWIVLALGALAVFIPAAFIRSWTGTEHHPLPVAVMTISTAVAMYAAGALLPIGVRAGVSWVFADRLDRRFADAVASGRRPRGMLVRLSVPSHADMLFAALWAWSLTLALSESFTAS